MDRKRTLSSVSSTTDTTTTSSSDDESVMSPQKKAKMELPSQSTDILVETSLPNYSLFAQRLMSQMGYKKGKGLGKNESGRVDIVEASNQRGRRGLGMRIEGLEANVNATWEEEDTVMIKQEPEWMPSCTVDIPLVEELHKWTTMSERKEIISDEYEFCEKEILDGILKNKSIFDKLGNREFLSARTRANPYETIRGGIFQNRAAMKMAEIDASFDFMFTSHKDRQGDKARDLLYFSDICAGPGGFSEYVLWKAKWHAKGFGFTLRAEGANDFKLDDFISGTPETFDCHYGVNGYKGNGDIFIGENIKEFQKYVLDNSEGGVHFVMADGGFSVEGQENIQEILSKQLYLCQFLTALGILRVGGHFVCKVFDLFTPFSMGLIYLMYMAFDAVCIFKPVTSRPANSERYLVCKELKDGTLQLFEYMFDLNEKINKLKGTNIDIREVVPLETLKRDENFFEYMLTSNNVLGARQILGLRKLITYVQNTNLVGPDQGEVRKQCLNAWHIPVEARSRVVRNDPDNQFDKLFTYGTTGWMSKKANELTLLNINNIKSIHDYKCQLSGGEQLFLLGLGRRSVYQWNPKESKMAEWKRIDHNMNFELPRLSLLHVEFVYELKGAGRGQRKVMAVHVLDVIYLGGVYYGDKSLSERLANGETFCKALSKPCRSDVVVVRMKPSYNMTELMDVVNNMEMKHMKPRMEQRLASYVSNDRYFVPTGIHLIRKVREPWHLQLSRSSQRFYFFNEKSHESLFDMPKDALADVKYCLSSRLYWDWSRNLTLNLTAVKDGVLDKHEFSKFVASKS